MEYVYLVKIDSGNNNNRYYRMIKDGDIFRIEMGRVGAAPVTSKRPMCLWQDTYDKKIKEGYVDRSQYTTVEHIKEQKYREIPDLDVRNLVDTLMHYANRSLDENYSISYRDVNQRMIDKAQEHVCLLSQENDLQDFNRLLFELFQIIPRKMKSVSDMLADRSEDMEMILEREQELLDVMTTKVSQSVKGKSAAPSKTILEDWGLNIRICSEKENEQIKKHLTKESAHLFKRAFRVHNLETDRKFDDYCRRNGVQNKDVHFLYHGSKNMNYMGIITEGLKLNPKAAITGKMFGYGLYFAPRAKKSIGYTNINGAFWTQGNSKQAFLAVYKVAYQNPKNVSDWTSNMKLYRNVRPYDALYAHAGSVLKNDEIIIYDERQATLQYLIELATE